jgi:hypothetical protein
VAAGAYHSLGLKDDGTIVAWGGNYEGQCDAPLPNAGFVAVVAGYWHSLGLKADGSIVAWGYNMYGQCDVPPPNEGFVAMEGGGYHTLGLKADGSVVAWGSNSYGQCDVPSPNDGFVAVAAGEYHSLGLRADAYVRTKWYVDDDSCPGPGSGTMADPFCSIQDAIDSAVEGDEVIVAPGTYLEAIRFAHSARGITVRSANPKDPSVVAATIIDATGLGSSVVYCSGMGLNIVLAGLTITGGDATYGGGLYNYWGGPTATHCVFIGNTAEFGGGVWDSAGGAKLTHCTFRGNAAVYGGGIFSSEGSPKVTHCTFNGNAAAYSGGGMWNDRDSSPTVTNCIFWGDTPDEIYNSGTSSPVVTYSDVQGGHAGTGNIDANPLFADAAYGDYHLSPGSPCIDAGNNAAAVVFGDTTTGAGTQTSVIVSDASRYAIDDEIEYDGDGVLRTVTAVDPNSGQVTFDDPLAAPSEPNAPIANYGWGDMDGDDRILGYTVEMGADEFVPAELMATEPADDGSLPKTCNNVILCVFSDPIALPAAGNPLVIKDMTGGCVDVSADFSYSVDADDPNGTTLKAKENGDLLADLHWYQVESAGGWTDVVPFGFEIYTLAGDADNSGRVTTADYTYVKAAMGDRGDIREDLNGSGRVTTADYGIVKAGMAARQPTKPALCL